MHHEKWGRFLQKRMVKCINFLYKIKTRIPSGIWLRLYVWTVHGLYKSYTGQKARVESRSANHLPSRLGHEGAHDGL